MSISTLARSKRGCVTNLDSDQREQARREAEQCADDPKVSATASAWAHKWLALDSELEQAERERDEARKMIETTYTQRDLDFVQDNTDEYAARAFKAEARLARVPALVEALRKAGKDLADVGSAGWDSSRWRLRDAAVARVNAALTVYEQSHGGTE